MSSLQIHRANGTLTLTLNRPEVHNAFDGELISGLTSQLQVAGNDPETRVVVLTGHGASFSAGADLNWMRSMLGASEKTNEHDALQLARLLRTLNYLPVPTVARVNGAAIGGGLGLVACCDIAVASDTAVFALSEARLGLAPAIISPYVFRRIGESQARRFFLTGERFDAEHARRLGLVHDVVDPENLDEAVEGLCDAIRRGGPQGVAESKKLVFHAAGHSADRQLELDQATARLIARLRISAEGQEGMRAFLEKRPPGWLAGE
ncbi:MAG: enoyl-CoA hydratase-related protein [Xanthomonadales bacterium]|jgi:methylglutaconyl-CoA hydratase|nr:enoyl-CoA hydratase-related protein [Xanthomonadales bacterium]